MEDKNLQIELNKIIEEHNEKLFIEKKRQLIYNIVLFSVGLFLLAVSNGF
ncbi:MAG: hypothetical protein V3575_00360 [Candidatus Absconditabacteria bacterium]